MGAWGELPTYTDEELAGEGLSPQQAATKDAREREQLIHCGRHLAPEVTHNFLCRSHNGF